MKPKSRKEEYAEMTRQALLEAALKLFIQKGYHNTSIEDIVQEARLTRGALYHHYKSKEEIFIRLYKDIVTQLVGVIETATNNISDPWQKALIACNSFLNCCIDPKFISIRLDDAIGVLGWERWRAIDSSYTMKVLKEILVEIHDAGQLSTDSIDTASNMIYALLIEGALSISASADKKKAHSDAVKVMQKMLLGLKKYDK